MSHGACCKLAIFLELDTTKEWARLLEKAERLKASVRAKVEHPFRVVKQQFGYATERYRSLPKNTVQLTMLSALGNMWMTRRQLMGWQGWVRPRGAWGPPQRQTSRVARRGSTAHGLGIRHHDTLIACPPLSIVTNVVLQTVLRRPTEVGHR